jgi:two-component system, LytTR family, sensor histidine kinase AlgZ
LVIYFVKALIVKIALIIIYLTHYYNQVYAVRKNSRLPNFQNLGILLRILLIVNILATMAAILLSQTFSDFLPLLAQLSALVQPVLLLSLLGLYLLYPLLNKLKYWQGISIIFLLALSITYLIFVFVSQLFVYNANPEIFRACLLSIMVTAIVLYYFHLQQRAYSPAIAEARLQALQARIRPHFLFNSINAVLSLIRSQPKRAETALEDMADLFRVLMSENRDLVPLADEISLCHKYLDLEKLRLEERLKITWQIADMPSDAMIPPLILQPLLENAVYHGIEPMPEGGEIIVKVFTKLKALHISISNPYAPKNDKHSGNKMAMKNIKERLQLHFDLESSLKTSTANNRYEVHISIPAKN